MRISVQISKRFHTQHFGTFFFAYLFWNHFMVKRFCLWKTAGRGDSAKKLHLPCIEIFNIKTPKVVLFRQEASIPNRSFRVANVSGLLLYDHSYFRIFSWLNFWVLVTLFHLVQKNVFSIDHTLLSQESKAVNQLWCIAFFSREKVLYQSLAISTFKYRRIRRIHYSTM